jgi:hypothetical protein
LKSLQDDHHARARDDAQAALARAEAEQRARLAKERDSQQRAALERARAAEEAREAERMRLEAGSRAEVARSAELDDRMRLERASAELTQRVTELERALQLSELAAQAARFRDRLAAWLSGSLCVLVVAGTLGFYYGRLRPERTALDAAQANALAAEARQANGAQSLLAQAQRRNDELTSQISNLRDALRNAARAPAATTNTHPNAHGSGARSIGRKGTGDCVGNGDSGDPLDPCFKPR